MSKKSLLIVIAIGAIAITAAALPMYAGHLSRSYFHDMTQVANSSMGPGVTYEVLGYSKGVLSSKATTILVIKDGEDSVELALDHLIKHSYGNILGRSFAMETEIGWDTSSPEIAGLVDRIPELRNVRNIMAVETDGSLVSNLSVPAFSYTESGATAAFDGMLGVIEYAKDDVPKVIGSITVDAMRMDSTDVQASCAGGKMAFRYFQESRGLYVGDAEMILNDIRLEYPAADQSVRIEAIRYLADQSVDGDVVNGGFELQTVGLEVPDTLELSLKFAFKALPVEALIKVQQISRSRELEAYDRLFSEGIIQQIIDSDAHLDIAMNLKNDDGKFSADAQLNLSGDIGRVRSAEGFAANPLWLMTLPRVDARAHIHKDLLVRTILTSMNKGVYPSDEDMVRQENSALQMIEPLLIQDMVRFDQQSGVFRSSFSYANGAGLVNGKRVF